MKRRLLSLLLAVCMLAALLPSTALAAGGRYAGESAVFPPIITPSEHGRLEVSNLAPRRWDEVVITAYPDEGYELGSLTINDSTSTPVPYVKNADGTYTFVQPNGNVGIAGEFVTADVIENYQAAASCDRGADCPANRFADLDASLWYHNGVHYCIDQGVMNGSSATQFSPDAPASRAMMITILWRLSGSPTANYAISYTDVPEGFYYTEAIAWAAQKHLADGYGDGTFGPDDPITREQLATMLYRYEEIIMGGGYGDNWMFLLTFSDSARVSLWADEAVHWMVEHEVLGGKGNNILDPGGKATRAEAATMIYRYLTQR